MDTCTLTFLKLPHFNNKINLCPKSSSYLKIIFQKRKKKNHPYCSRHSWCCPDALGYPFHQLQVPIPSVPFDDMDREWSLGIGAASPVSSSSTDIMSGCRSTKTQSLVFQEKQL